MLAITPSIHNLSEICKNPELINWKEHHTLGRSGSKIFDIYCNEVTKQRISLVWCAPGSSADTHIHLGHETFLILTGEFEDHNGTYKKGDLVCYTDNSEHGWCSPKGAMIYAVWGGAVIQSENETSSC